MTGIDKDADAVRDALNVRPHTGTQPHLDALGALDRLAATAREAERDLKVARKTHDAYMDGAADSLNKMHARAEAAEKKANLLPVQTETARLAVERAEAAETERDRLAQRVKQLETALEQTGAVQETMYWEARRQGIPLSDAQIGVLLTAVRATLSSQPTEPQETA